VSGGFGTGGFDGTQSPAFPSPPPTRPGLGATARSLDVGGELAEVTFLPQLLGAALAVKPEKEPPFQLQVATPPRGPRPTPGLRTLGRLNGQVEVDAHRYLCRVDQMAMARTNITDMIATMRQELRGSFLNQVPLLSRNVINDQDFLRLVGKLRPWTFEQGETIIVEGEIGDKLFIIERGTCEVIKTINGRPHCVGQLSKGAFFGEIAPLYDIPRTATVQTTSACTALSLARSDLLATVNDAELEKMRVIARTQVFSSIPLLNDLDSDEKVRIAQALKKQKWRQNAIITGENHITSRLYIVEHGTILMEAKSKDLLPSFWPIDQEPKIVLGPGGFFGMRGLLYGAPVGFNITALTEVDTLSISYEEILATSPPEDRQKMQSTMVMSMRHYLLRQIPQLKQMAEEYFRTIAAQAEQVTFKKWSVIFAKGERLDSVYVLEKGMVSEHPGERMAMCELPGETEENANADATPPRVTPGEFFGVECLTNKAATASCTLVALTDVTMLRLPPAAVWSVLQEERQHIARIPLLSHEVLGKAEQYMLVGKLKPWSFRAGQTIIREGDIGDMLYVIEKGVCDASKMFDGKEVAVSQLKKGAFFGELAVMYDMPRNATVTAATDVEVVSLSREDIFSVVSPEKIVKMRHIACTQVFQQSSALLQNLEKHEKIMIAEQMQSCTTKKGEIIQREGEAESRFHMIEKGEVTLMRNGKEIGKRYAGFMVGEMTAMFGEPARCTCVASTEEVKTLTISMESIYGTACTGERPALERKLLSNFRRELISKMPQMQGKSDEYISAVCSYIEPSKFAKGEVLFESGRKMECAYIVECGEVSVQGGPADFGAEDRQRAEPRRLYGDECLVMGADGELVEARASYSLVAASDCSVLRLPKGVAQLILK